MDKYTENATKGSYSASVSDSPGPPSMTENAWDSYDTVFLNAKAGMDGVDKKKVQKVVYDMSKGSRYFNNEQRKEADVLQRVEYMKSRAASFTPAQLAEHEKATDLKIAELEASRDLSRIWVHVDMDAFYAAVETLVNPSLADKPMAVGGMSMICTANYEARKFGVRAAMPGFIARKLCPDLIFVRPDFKKYSHYSDLSRKVFHEYDPNFVARSLDEAYLDITKPCELRSMSAAEVVEELRNEVHSATGLSCSAGVGPNRLLAKVCSDINKPNGQYVLKNERASVMAFVSTLPIRKVSGIGKVTERLLKDVLEVNTCADLLSKRSLISALFSQISTGFFLAVGLGIGGSETPEKEDRKSLSNERTFATISDEHQLFKKLAELVELLADDMQKEDLQGKTLTLKLKETGFEVRSRAATLPFFISTKAEIWEHASKLLKKELPISLRLMGLRMSKFKGKDVKPQPHDPGQRTVTSLITRFNTYGSGQLKGSTPKGFVKESLESSKTAHNRSLKARILSKQLFSYDDFCDNPHGDETWIENTDTLSREDSPNKAYNLASEDWIKDKQFVSHGHFSINSPDMKSGSWIPDWHFSHGEFLKNVHGITPERPIGDERFCFPGNSFKNAHKMDPETWIGDGSLFSKGESSIDPDDVHPEAWIQDDDFLSRTDLSALTYSPEAWASNKDVFPVGASSINGHNVIHKSCIQDDVFSGLESHAKNNHKSSQNQDRRPTFHPLDFNLENTEDSPQRDILNDKKTTYLRDYSSSRIISTQKTARSPHADLDDEGFFRAVERINYMDREVEGPSSTKKGRHIPLKTWGGLDFSSGPQSKANISIGGREMDMTFVEPNVERLKELEHDTAVPMQIWDNSDQCTLCGIRVNDCLQCARQEHEDFHFAMWLQQKSDSQNTQRSTGMIRATRPAGSESTKRKASGGKKASHTPQKKSSHLPLEAFFGRAK